jgi:LmbE family N-acetylglucosaminyl deacetylase
MKAAVEQLLRVVYGAYLPRPVRNSLLIQLLLLRRDADPVLATPPAGRRIAVLSPHMDDEVFGCGATLALAARSCSEVSAVYLADGTKGYPRARAANLDPAQVARLEAQLSAERREESRRAGKILGYAEPLFLDLPDGDLAPTREAVDRLADALASIRPDVVFLPFMTELNTDHWMTNAIFIAAARRAMLAPEVACWGYEVWTPLPANTLVDVALAMDLKRDAMAEFKSQLGEYDYPRAFVALAAYRSLLRRQGRGYLEAFWVSELDVYRRLYDRVAVARSAPEASEAPRYWGRRSRTGWSAPAIR